MKSQTKLLHSHQKWYLITHVQCACCTICWAFKLFCMFRVTVKPARGRHAKIIKFLSSQILCSFDRSHWRSHGVIRKMRFHTRNACIRYWFTCFHFNSAIVDTFASQLTSVWWTECLHRLYAICNLWNGIGALDTDPFMEIHDQPC